MALTIGAALFAGAVVLYVLLPILTGMEAPLDRGWDEITDAEARKTAALRALRDVEYDYHTGKLDDHDYEILRGELTAEAVAAIHADDEEVGKAGSGTAAPRGRVGADIEREILSIRQQFRAGLPCTACGHRNPDGSRFCAECGERVGAATA